MVSVILNRSHHADECWIVHFSDSGHFFMSRCDDNWAKRNDWQLGSANDWVGRNVVGKSVQIRFLGTTLQTLTYSCQDGAIKSEIFWASFWGRC